MLRFILIIGTFLLLLSCQRLERQNNESDKQDLLSEDNGNLLSKNNPFRMRDSIKHFAIIPNIPLNAKLKIFKSLQRFEYPPFAGEIKKIHRILYSSEKNIYLLYSEGIGCSNCLNKAFISLVLEKDTIDMNYPLFINQSDLLIETKNDNLLQFEYKPSSREIFLKLVNDTLIDTEFFPVDTISNLWKFDGQFFQSIVPESEKTIPN